MIRKIVFSQISEAKSVSGIQAHTNDTEAQINGVESRTDHEDISVSK